MPKAIKSPDKSKNDCAEGEGLVWPLRRQECRRSLVHSRFQTSILHGDGLLLLAAIRHLFDGGSAFVIEDSEWCLCGVLAASGCHEGAIANGLNCTLGSAANHVLV